MDADGKEDSRTGHVLQQVDGQRCRGRARVNGKVRLLSKLF